MSAQGHATVLVDGRPDGAVPVLDRGLHFGDGLFETMACVRGRVRFLDLHLERLRRGCARLNIAFEHWDLLRGEIRSLAADADPGLLKLILTRGPATARGYGARGDESATRILQLQPWPQEDPALARDGVTLRTGQMRLGENPALAGMKHLNRLEQVIARGEWRDPAIQESLLFSSSGLLVSGTMTNVFLVRAGSVLTPRLDRCGIHGVMRRVVLREALALGLAIEESDLFQQDVDAAQELFLTNARIGIWPVRRLDGRVLADGPVTARLRRHLAPMLEAAVDA